MKDLEKKMERERKNPSYGKKRLTTQSTRQLNMISKPSNMKLARQQTVASIDTSKPSSSKRVNEAELLEPTTAQPKQKPLESIQSVTAVSQISESVGGDDQSSTPGVNSAMLKDIQRR